MTYPFVAAAAKYGPRKGPVMAFVIHMAEGGGTVGFLSRPNDRGVSVHYVIESTGRIVQMVRESEASGSINPNDLRTSDDAAVFGASVRRRVMGAWDHDPNSAVITVEVEGFAKIGPNAAQHGSLKTLIADVRSRHPRMGLLGHRDFQDYKPCPGKLVHWDDFGGHGPVQQEEPDQMTNYRAVGEDWKPSVRPDASDAPVRLTPDRASPIAARLPAGTVIRTVGEFTQGGDEWRVTRLADGRTGFVIRGDLAPVKPGGDPTVDTPFANYVQRQPLAPVNCADAVAAEHERVRNAAIAAVEAL